MFRQGVHCFICVRWSKYFSRSPYFLVYQKISSGGTNLGGSNFTMTVATICLTIEHLQFRDKITELQMLRSVAYFTEYIMVLPIYQFSSRK